MLYDKDSFRAHYGEATDFLRRYRLPRWDDFPDLEIYMDQMIVLINRYLSDQETDRPVTASMINNYVKMRLMPPPVRKKYGRAHLAYLVVICSLKDALGMAVIEQMFPPGMEGDVLASATIPSWRTRSRPAISWPTAWTASPSRCSTRRAPPSASTTSSCRSVPRRTSPRRSPPSSPARRTPRTSEPRPLPLPQRAFFLPYRKKEPPPQRRLLLLCG